MDSFHLELAPKLIDSLYVEAMVLADEARACFDRDAFASEMAPDVAVAFSCESLRVTTRIMHSIAWLLAQKAMRAGEIAYQDPEASTLGYAPASDIYLRHRFPGEAQSIISMSEDLYQRLFRISEGMMRPANDMPEPVLMVERLRQAF